MHKVYFPTSLIILVLCMTFSACAQQPTELELKYGVDAYYFEGVCLVNEGETELASTKFQRASNSKNKLIADLSTEQMIANLPEEKRVSAAENLYRRKRNDFTLALLLQELFAKENYKRILALTPNLDFEKSDDKVIFYRCAALLKSKDPSFPGIFNKWSLVKPFSNYHQQIFAMVQEEDDNEFAFSSDLVRFSNAASLADWATSFAYVYRVLADKKNRQPHIMQYAGKVLLNGSSKYEYNASVFEKSIPVHDGAQFYVDFYTARMLEKVEEQRELAATKYQNAMKSAADEKQFDLGLWYYLNLLMEISPQRAVAAIEKYKEQWHDPSYFEDFFDTLSAKLLGEKLWETYYNTARMIDGYAPDESTAKFSYVSARLIESDLFTVQGADKDQICHVLFSRALHSGTDLYYKFLAAKKLGMSQGDIEAELEGIYTKPEESGFTPNKEIEKLIEGYIDFDLYDEVYALSYDHVHEISLECAKKAAAYLQLCGDTSDESFYPQSLRIASRKFRKSDAPLDTGIQKLNFPRYYSDLVSLNAAEKHLDESLLYALVRTESYFDTNAESWAGAVGLSQLMPSTAAELARRAHLETYDLKDAGTNLSFGAAYLADLVHSLEGNAILASCAYNGGIGRIRNWKKSFAASLERESIPTDLFVEMIPITETRNYGLKISSGTAMYAYLYYDKNPLDVIASLIFPGE